MFAIKRATYTNAINSGRWVIALGTYRGLRGTLVCIRNINSGLNDSVAGWDNACGAKIAIVRKDLYVGGIYGINYAHVGALWNFFGKNVNVASQCGGVTFFTGFACHFVTALRFEYRNYGAGGIDVIGCGLDVKLFGINFDLYTLLF